MRVEGMRDLEIICNEATEEFPGVMSQACASILNIGAAILQLARLCCYE